MAPRSTNSRLAGLRKPSDPSLREQAMQAWTEYSRRVAADLQSKRTKLAAGPQSTIERDLYFAEQNTAAKKLDEALKNVQDAETVLRNSAPPGAVSGATLKIQYAKAQVLAALDRITEALEALDAYDLNAVEEERAPSDKLRNQLLFNLANSLKTLKARLQAAWAGEAFSLAEQLAAQGLKMSSDDPDLLYYAGMAATGPAPARAGPGTPRSLSGSLRLLWTPTRNSGTRPRAWPPRLRRTRYRWKAKPTGFPG